MHFITYVKKVVAHRVEILLGACLVISISLLIVALRMPRDVVNLPEVSDGPTPTLMKNKELDIFVEISGSVYKPGVYQLKKDSRLYELLQEAGGLNKQADKGFFNRNYNQARVLEDGEKIHAPSIEEVVTGAFLEQPLIIYTNEIGTTEPVTGSMGNQNTEASKTAPISINSASGRELEELTGVGKVTSEKIITGRPYGSVEELKTRGIISASLYEKIVGSISL